MKISDLSKHKQVTLIAPVGGKGERGNLITTTTERKPNTSNVLDAAKTSTKNLIINDMIITKDGGIYIVKGFDGVNYVVEETEVDLKGRSITTSTEVTPILSAEGLVLAANKVAKEDAIPGDIIIPTDGKLYGCRYK